MGYIKSYSSGRILFKIDGDYIKDFGGMIKYKIKDNKILEYPSNEILYVIDGNYIKSFSNRILLNITSIEPLMTKVTRFLLHSSLD